MALTKGSKRLFEWLRDQRAGAIVTREKVMEVAGWSAVSLKTYLNKNKIAPFLQRLPGQDLKILLNGDEISEQYFDETFTQTAPRRVSLAAGDDLIGEFDGYELVEPIGAGAVGRVWTAKPAGGSKLVAAKVMLPREDLLQSSKLPNVRERFRREARYGRGLEHKNIVRYLDVGQVERNPFLIMELAARSVQDKIDQAGAIPEEEAAEIVESCIAGLEFLHGKGHAHRDVKPDNILEFATGFKLGDLGIVKWSDFDPVITRGGTITRQSVQLGSWFYMAPEQQESPHNVGPSCDIYALGVTWIQMLAGEVPAPQAVGAGAYEIPALRGDIAGTIRAMCAYRPSDRPTLEEINRGLRDVYGG